VSRASLLLRRALFALFDVLLMLVMDAWRWLGTSVPARGSAVPHKKLGLSRRRSAPGGNLPGKWASVQGTTVTSAFGTGGRDYRAETIDLSPSSGASWRPEPRF
jgi:hypothetical protein